MEASKKQKMDCYLEALEELKQKTGNEITAVTILQEIAKDERMVFIREDRQGKTSEPATKKQKNFMKELGIKYPRSVTKQEASILIDEKQAAREAV